MANIVEAVCLMPIAFTKRRNVSMLDLLRESGYPEHRAIVNEAVLQAHLRSHPDLIDVWVGYSEDQRCAPAYYLRPPDETVGERKWAVGYLTGHGSGSPEKLFADRYAACAHFIQEYVESFRPWL